MPQDDQGEAAPGLTALTPSEFKTVEAISGRIMPATDTPGAIEAGSAFYIDQALAGAYEAQRATYQRGLAELDRVCVAAHGQAFTGLDEAQQDAVLTALEAGEIPEIDKGAQFFALLRTHVLEGFFCEPQYGGNRDLIGWKLVGFPGQRYGYDDAYINRVIDLNPIACDGLPQKGD
jgi:gluconate 2-dehydrogenase gamma chain